MSISIYISIVSIVCMYVCIYNLLTFHCRVLVVFGYILSPPPPHPTLNGFSGSATDYYYDYFDDDDDDDDDATLAAATSRATCLD